jgi:hypothetical protein
MMSPLKIIATWSFNKRPRGTRNCTLRPAGTSTEKGEGILIYNFGRTHLVGGTTQVLVAGKIWIRSALYVGSQDRTDHHTANWSDLLSAWRHWWHEEAGMKTFSPAACFVCYSECEEYPPSCSVYCDVTCSFVDRHRSIRETLLLHLQGFERCEATSFSETYLPNYTASHPRRR